MNRNISSEAIWNIAGDIRPTKSEEENAALRLLAPRCPSCLSLIWITATRTRGMNRANRPQRSSQGVRRANDRPTRRWQTAIRWKRGNGTAVVVLTNDLTPVWTVVFDEIRIISVGACQCKCHTYIQLPLVTLRSARGQPTTEYSCSTSFSPSAPAILARRVVAVFARRPVIFNCFKRNDSPTVLISAVG